jgi:hypothetical protein
MLIYDLDINAWVQRPGDSTPPQMTPALVAGGTYSIGVQFYRGSELQDMGAASAWLARIRVIGDHAGTPIATADSADEDGENAIVFSLEIETAYFTTNPTLESVDCVLAIGYTLDGVSSLLSTLPVTIQNSYSS